MTRVSAYQSVPCAQARREGQIEQRKTREVGGVNRVGVREYGGRADVRAAARGGLELGPAVR